MQVYTVTNSPYQLGVRDCLAKVHIGCGNSATNDHLIQRLTGSRATRGRRMPCISLVATRKPAASN